MDPSRKQITWRRLIALDFDDTIAGQNTDIVARDLLDPSLLTPELRELYKVTGWTAYMQAIFDLLFEHQFTPNQIRDAIGDIDEVPGMVQLIRTLSDQYEFDVIIVSDSNAEFINVWCSKQNGLNKNINAVFTNPASFEGNHLKIAPYHHQTECSLSTANLCKGQIVEDYVSKRWRDDDVGYGRIFYVGDGSNDFCPILRLGSDDFGCARVGKRLEQRLQDSLEKNDERLEAEVLRWKDGLDLLDQIHRLICTESVTPNNIPTAPEVMSRKSICLWK